MGLDTVELVMAFEEKFAITITNDEAENLITPRDVMNLIYSKVQHADAKTCLTQRAFHNLRRALQSEIGLNRAAIKPATQLETIIPLESRQASWARLQNAVAAAKWPGLHRARQIRIANTAGSVGVGATVWVAAAPSLSQAYALALAAAAALGGAVLLTRATQHLRLHFQQQRTVGQLAEYLVAHQAMALQPEAEQGWSREQIRTIVRAIIIEHLNVDPTFSDDASFVDDLGAD